MAYITHDLYDQFDNHVPSGPSTDWSRGATFQLYLRSFADGDGDGVGDLKGALARLSYIKDLGVDAVWVSPWFVSPMADGGYDVADYCDINPMFGTLHDADVFIEECHRLGIKVMIDIVPNHCSKDHPWFQAALAAAVGSPERERFYFRDGRGENGEEPPTDWVSVFGGRAWTRVANGDGTPGQWYLHLFDSAQPDLNWSNPVVRDSFDQIFRFWFDRGVDGFRLDAVPAIGKDPDFQDAGCEQSSQFAPETSPQTRYWDAGDVHQIVKLWRRIADSYEPGKYLIGEINVNTTEALLRYIRPGELHSVFAMNLAKAPWSAAEFRSRIAGNLDYTANGEAWPTWVLSSHDEVRSVTRFAHRGDGSFDAALGTRRARAALLVTLALPGSVCLYQGEELGLPQVTDLPRELLEDPIVARTGNPDRGRDGCRVAMPWDSSSPSFGFSSGRPRLPQPSNWGELCVESQEADVSSTLHFTRNALRIRRDHILHQPDECVWVELGVDVLSFDRGAIRCIVNFGDQSFALPRDSHILLASDELRDDLLAPGAGVWIVHGQYDDGHSLVPH